LLNGLIARAVAASLVALACALGAAGSADSAVPPIGDGAWSWFGDPRAVTHTGAHTRTYTGWVDRDGDIMMSSFDHATRERVTAALAARLNRDDHANPSIQVRPDGRLVVFYSRHVGPAMHYRVSSRPEDVTSWEAPQTVPVNTPGIRGYTYPNPVRLEGEGQTYLFWRGGNYNPTFSVQADGSSTWSPARNLILMPGERPYVKYASSGGDTIHVAYTNAHPGEFGDVNVYYARVRAGRVERAGGQQVGTLSAPIAPADGDLVYDGVEPAWVHDVAADAAGRPVVLLASFPSASDHRYRYARWTGAAWEVREITAAGGSFREDGGSPYYSGGLTLDHEDPSRVYLSRQVGPGSWRVEAWTTPDGGASWNSQAISPPDAGKNVRPLSPRGMAAFGGDLSAIWMRGPYPNYVDYETSIAAVTSDDANLPPVADAEPAVRSGPGPLEVRFDGALSYDPDAGGGVATWQWDFGDGTGATGREVTHTYTGSGRFFPTLTVTDNAGAESKFVEEITVGLPAAPFVHTGGAGGTTVHGAVDPENQPTQWLVEYGPTAEYGATTSAESLPGDDALHQVSAGLPGLVHGRLYHYRLVASNASGSAEGSDRVMIAGSAPGSDAYRDAVFGTPGLASHWRLGELSGSSATDEVTGGSGALEGRVLLGALGVLGPLANTAMSFDGASGGLSAPGPELAGSGTIEGWFRWRAGTATVRDHTGPSGGWLLAFNSAGTLRYRVGGSGFDTGRPIESVRDGEWHHLVATKSGGAARLYLDGTEIHSGGGAESTPAATPWHVMRNGTNQNFSEGEADEVALYTRALSAAEVKVHYDLARGLAAVPLPPESGSRVVDPPAAGSGRGGGVLHPQSGRVPVGSASVRRGRLVVHGAARKANRLLARRRGAAWRVSDAAAGLRAGRGCRRITARSVGCRAALVRRIALYGGSGNDRLTVLGRIPTLLAGGPGNDRLTGGRSAVFRGGPGADRLVRRGPRAP
jgi:PKD repeat protein